MRRSRSSDGAGRVVRWLALAMFASGCGSAPGQPIAPLPPSCPDRAVVAAQADVARLAGCATLGGLTVRTGAPLDVGKLRALTAITGDLTIGPTVAIQEVALGELRSVDGAIRVVGNGLLQGLFLPKLERAGRIEIDGNGSITTVAMPRLVSVRGSLAVTDNASLEALDVPALTALDGELVVVGDPQLALLDTGRLQRAAAVRIDAPKLPPDVAALLRATVGR